MKHSDAILKSCTVKKTIRDLIMTLTIHQCGLQPSLLHKVGRNLSMKGILGLQCKRSHCHGVCELANATQIKLSKDMRKSFER